MSESKPLFIPLKGEYYDAFISGDKKFEYRKYGGYWSEKHIWPGRNATLSRGYGKHHRRSATVTSFEVVRGDECPNPRDVKAVYGTTDIQIAKIGIELS